MDDRILVTGSSGAIGTELVERLLNDGKAPICVDTRRNQWSEDIDDITHKVDISDGLADAVPVEDVDTVVHLAANSRVDPTIENPGLAFQNVKMTQGVLEFAREAAVEHVLFASSREVYGDDSGVVKSEDDASLDSSINPYAASKTSCESFCWAFAECYDIDISVFRLSNVYGRYDIHSRVVPTFVTRALNGEDLVVYGPDKVLDFVYVDDVVDALLSGIRKTSAVPNEVVNIGSGQATSLVELAERVARLAPESVHYQVKQSRTGEVSRYVADITKANRLLGYRPSYTLEEGLSQTMSWYRENVDCLDTTTQYTTE